jgi:hypothetical protein
MLRTPDQELALTNLTQRCGYYFNVDRARWTRGIEATQNNSAMIFNANTGKFDICGFMLLTWQDSEMRRLAGLRYPSQYVQMYLGKKEKCVEPLNWFTTSSQSDSAEVLELIKINDDPALDDFDRELTITRILANLWAIGARWVDDSGTVWTAPRLAGVTDYNTYFRDIEEATRRRRIDERNRERNAVNAARRDIESTDATLSTLLRQQRERSRGVSRSQWTSPVLDDVVSSAPPTGR